jgi:GT2 family glycosyltransferase
MKQSPTLTIVILNFNTAALTKRAVESTLAATCEQGLRIVIVDNASSDTSTDVIRTLIKKHAEVSGIFLKENIGFAAGNNAALKDLDTPYVMLLNSDAYFPEGSNLDVLLTYIETHPQVAVLTPKVILGNGNLDPACHRGFPTPYASFSYFSGLEKLFPHSVLFGRYHQTWKDMDVIHEIDACTGAAMLVRTKALSEIGLLDERFFMYGEDLDWCYRFKEKQFVVMYHPGLTVIHDKHRSGVKKLEHDQTETALLIQTKTRAAFWDAMKLFYHKHYRSSYPWFVEQLMLGGIELVRRIRKH